MQATASINFVTKFRLAVPIEKMEARWKQVTDIDRIHRQQSCIREGLDSLYVLRAVGAWERIFAKMEKLFQTDVHGLWVMKSVWSRRPMLPLSKCWIYCVCWIFGWRTGLIYRFGGTEFQRAIVISRLRNIQSLARSIAHILDLGSRMLEQTYLRAQAKPICVDLVLSLLNILSSTGGSSTGEDSINW
jgi:hypothetical protein